MQMQEYDLIKRVSPIGTENPLDSSCSKVPLIFLILTLLFLEVYALQASISDCY